MGDSISLTVTWPMAMEGFWEVNEEYANDGAVYQSIPDEAGEYSIVYSSASSCNLCASEAMVTYIVHNLPNASFSVGEEGLTASTAESYQWLLNGQPIVAATDQSYVPLEDGDYAVEVTSANGCTATSPPQFVTSTSEFVARHFSLFPNPAKDKITISGMALVGKAISLYDAEGRLVLELVAEANDQVIDLSKLPTGTYSLRCSGWFRQFVKM